ncbi:hypothetical protein [Haloarchaeobius sp. TZWWS8]|uniref:hypothetical protein n=1 Tax=Haloarchaeobius sp. TZWWS8 TaxID=3446121 RepID=UPI003EBE5709
MAADPNRLIRALVYAVFGFLTTVAMGVAFNVPPDIAMLQGSAVAIAMIFSTFALATAGF